VSGIRRGHPGRCDHYVECVNMTVPVGKACPDGQCRRSMTGICTNDCSENVCNETVPEGNCVVNIEFVCFSEVRVTRSLAICVMLCRSLFVLFLLVFVLSVLRVTDSDKPFGIFKLFVMYTNVCLA
jgi:hypothetical protein